MAETETAFDRWVTRIYFIVMMGFPLWFIILLILSN